MRVKLYFNLVLDLEDTNNIDGLGREIAVNILGELFNGEDVLEVEYAGHSHLSD